MFPRDADAIAIDHGADVFSGDRGPGSSTRGAGTGRAEASAGPAGEPAGGRKWGRESRDAGAKVRSSVGEGSESRRGRFGVPTGVPAVGVLAPLPVGGGVPSVSSTFRNVSLTPTAAEHT